MATKFPLPVLPNRPMFTRTTQSRPYYPGQRDFVEIDGWVVSLAKEFGPAALTMLLIPLIVFSLPIGIRIYAAALLIAGCAYLLYLTWKTEGMKTLLLYTAGTATAFTGAYLLKTWLA